MDNIREIVKDVISKMSQKQPDIRDQLDRVWLEIIDGKQRKHMRLTGIKDGQVSVCVDSPAWLFQMKIKKGEILKKLKNKIPEIKDLIFRVGKV
ncbi:MAG TPA: DciA family protein [Candidatus Omnitrophota bacterium]|nr:DciA family protein [Candidatus Omnitrophota bacterium]